MNLSRRALWLAALTLLIGATGQWAPQALNVLGIHAGYWWRLPAGLLLLMATAEGLATRLIDVPVFWQTPGRLQLGRAEQLLISVSNPHPRPLQLRLYPRDNSDLRFAPRQHDLKLAAGETRQLTVDALPIRIGDCQMPAIPLRILGRFGLLWWSRTAAASSCHVTPDSLHGNERHIGTRPDGQVTRRHRGEGLELLALREYRPGDSHRRISWKATARAQRLIVQERAEEQRLELVIVLDTGRASGLRMGASDAASTLQAMQRLHHNINIAARLGELALSMGDRLALIIYAGRVINEQVNLSGPVGVRRLRNTLQTVESRTEESNPLAAAVAVRHLRQPRSLVAWLTDFDSGDHEALIRSARLLMPRHLPMLGTAIDPALEHLAAQPAREWADPQTSLAAMQAREGLHSTELRLARFGAEVVSAAPDRLDAAMLARYRLLRSSGRV